jgi:Asp-tRNA(Asn)/Glu-tRNA(Gln) amidotransferase A subunit family amidase
VRTAIANAELWEPTLHAFTWLARETVLERAEQRPRGGPLDGVPVAVKDIFDTAGIPTEYGTPLFAGRVPARSAEAVRRIEAAGGVMFGKTVTAEFAYFAPGPTTNPWLATHTPGGSSMGSPAAVAAGIVPVALGTQTNGSTIRPAAFCGVLGFKPTGGRLSTDGVLRFSPSLDQVGLFADDLARAAAVCAVLAAEPLEQWWAPQDAPRPPRLAVVRSPEWEQATPTMRAAFDVALGQLAAAGATLTELVMPPALADAIDVHQTIMAVEAVENIGPLVARDPQLCSVQLRTLLDRGRAAAPSAYEAALGAQMQLRDVFSEWLGAADALVTLATLGEAPGLDGTGDPRCATRWSLIGAPALAIPCALGTEGLPLAVQLVGARGSDSALLQTAAWVATTLPSIGRPPAPH